MIDVLLLLVLALSPFLAPLVGAARAVRHVLQLVL